MSPHSEQSRPEPRPDPVTSRAPGGPPDGGRVALVTGASRGIGLGVARALVDRGDRVCVTGRNEEALAAAVEQLGGPGRAMGVAGKAHDQAHQAEVVDRVLEAYGRLDYLVNNAGTNPAAVPLAEADLRLAHKVFETNVLSALGLAQQAHRAWQREHGGAIVNVASVSGLGASPFLGMYGMSKAAMINLTQQLAHELAPRVRVNAVAPAVVKTRFAAMLWEGREQEVSGAYPMGRLGVPQDVAGAVAFLLSDEAGWITGQTLVIDGGLLLSAGVS